VKGSVLSPISWAFQLTKIKEFVMQYQEQEMILASWYQGESLDEYLNAMFGYYEAEGKASVATRASTVGTDVDNAAGGEAPTAIAYRSTFEAILAKFGLDLGDASFDEIIKGDYYSVLKRHGLVDMMPANNAEYQSLGGVV
jgi:hypothetical protein